MVVVRSFFPSDQDMRFFPDVYFLAQVILVSVLAPPRTNLIGMVTFPDTTIFPTRGGKT
jgi:hypothetical protein